MLSDINRRRLEWVTQAKIGDMFPTELFKKSYLDHDHEWGTTLGQAAKEALDLIDELEGQLHDLKAPYEGH